MPWLKWALQWSSPFRRQCYKGRALSGCSFRCCCYRRRHVMQLVRSSFRDQSYVQLSQCDIDKKRAKANVIFVNISILRSQNTGIVQETSLDRYDNGTLVALRNKTTHYTYMSAKVLRKHYRLKRQKGVGTLVSIQDEERPWSCWWTARQPVINRSSTARCVPRSALHSIIVCECMRRTHES